MIFRRFRVMFTGKIPLEGPIQVWRGKKFIYVLYNN